MRFHRSSYPCDFVKEYNIFIWEKRNGVTNTTESPFWTLLLYFVNIFASSQNNPIKSNMVTETDDNQKKNKLHFETVRNEKITLIEHLLHSGSVQRLSDMLFNVTKTH